MYSIAYVVPYFGKFPKGFEFWLLSCRCNPTIDWLIFTDDRTEYCYPENVKVTYCSLADIRQKAQRLFAFPISLERPYKLCDYKPAYGDIFSKELEGYDFWGHCDIDLVWGNIRKFYTDDLLMRYEKIGFSGHSLLYRNTKQVSQRYRSRIEGIVNYEEVYSVDKSYAFDEIGMDAIYEKLKIPVYVGIDFANLLKYDYGFYLDWQTEDDRESNQYQVFTWKNGTLTRHYLLNGELKTEEYMYLHYWCRPTTFRIQMYSSDRQYLIYADTTTDKSYDVTAELVRRKSRRKPICYYMKAIWFNRKKLTLERILFNIRGMLAYKSK